MKLAAAETLSEPASPKPSVLYKHVVEAETRAANKQLISEKGLIVPKAVEELSSALLESFSKENFSLEPGSVRVVDETGRTPRYSVKQIRDVVEAVVRAVIRERNNMHHPLISSKKSKEKDKKSPVSERRRRTEFWATEIDPDGELEGPTSATTLSALQRLEYNLRPE